MTKKKRLPSTVFKRLRGRFPKSLPIGLEDFNRFCTDLFETYQIPQLDSYRNAVANMIMHLGPTTTRVKPKYFADSIRKAQANEVAFSVMQELRAAAKREAEAKEVKNDECSTEGTEAQSTNQGMV